MRRTVLSLSAAALAVIVFAGIASAAGPRSGTSSGTTASGRAGSGLVTTGARRGPGGGTTPVVTASLTAAQQVDLTRVAEDEKLAADLYETLAAQYGSAEMAAIARSEDVHLASIRNLLARYGIADPTAGRAVGDFATPAVEALYDKLLAQGSASLDAAYSVGVAVEQTDIADLTTARADGVLPTDVGRVYSNLQRASGYHLASFQALLAS